MSHPFLAYLFSAVDTSVSRLNCRELYFSF